MAMRKIIILAATLLACSVAVAQYVGYDTGYTGQSRGASYQAGGAPAGWDTVVVIFSPAAMVASAAIDTFAYPASADTADVNRIRRLNNIRLGRYIHSWRGDPADIDPTHAEAVKDTAAVIRLGTGTGGRFACPTFAYGVISKADSNGTKVADGPGVLSKLYSDGGSTIDGVFALGMYFDRPGRFAELVYIPWQNHIPAGSTIVSATGNFSPYTETSFIYSDSLLAVQMSNASDNKWYLTKGLTNFPDYAHVSYSHQEDTNGATWTGTERYAWSPALETRKNWDFGYISDWSGSGVVTFKAKQGIDYKLTNCVQSVVNGGVNNGYALIYEDGGPTTIYPHGWDDYGTTATGRTPYVVVKYITKRYQKPFGSAEWAFVFQSDDGIAKAASAWVDTLARYGGKMTMYVAEIQLNKTGSTAVTRGSTGEELAAYHDAGHEIGSHSKWHIGSLNYNNRITKGLTTGTGIGSTAYDSLLVDTSPEWMYTLADSIGRFDLRTSPMWGKSYGAPSSQLGPYAQRALIDHPYVSIRALAWGQTYDREKYYSIPLPSSTNRADSTMAGAPYQYGRHVRNMSIYAPWDLFRLVAGRDTSVTTRFPTHLDSVTTHFKRSIFTKIGNDTRVFCAFSHDLKNDGAGTYASGGGNLQGDELGAMCRVIRQWGGRYMTARELAEWYLNNATVIDHPFNAARSDTFDVFEADRVWGKPHGVDNRWIRGVK